MLFKELILNGFDGSGDTDHLIVWVALEEEFLPKLETLANDHSAQIDDLAYLYSDSESIDPAIDLVIVKDADLDRIKWDIGSN